MSAYSQQAENTYRRLRSKIDCTCLGFNKPDGEPLSEVYLHPMTAGSHAALDRSLGGDKEGDFEFAVLEFFFRGAQDENGRPVFDQQDRETLPYRIPKSRIKKLIPAILEAMRNDMDEYLEEAEGNSDEAVLPAAAISSLRN